MKNRRFVLDEVEGGFVLDKLTTDQDLSYKLSSRRVFCSFDSIIDFLSTEFDPQDDLSCNDKHGVDEFADKVAS